MTVKLRCAAAALASFAFAGLVLVTGTGCGALSTVSDPKVAWAVQDPAPMQVVVRRADVADTTVREVHRLLVRTPVGDHSDWFSKVALGPEEAAAEMREAGKDPMYAESHARVVTAEAWARTLPRVTSSERESPNLLAGIRPDVADAYATIMARKADIAAIGALVAGEQQAIDAKDVSPDDRARHQSSRSKLEDSRREAEAEVAPLERAFLANAKVAATQLAPERRERLGPAVRSLLQALADADVANSAAAVRYAAAQGSLVSSLRGVVPVIVADIIEEKTGTRPDVTRLTSEIALSATEVSLTLAGLSPTDLGDLELDELTRETIARANKWVTHAATLLSSVASTRDAIAFQTEALGGILAGMRSSNDAAQPIPTGTLIASAGPTK